MGGGNYKNLVFWSYKTINFRKRKSYSVCSMIEGKIYTDRHKNNVNRKYRDVGGVF